MSKNITKEDALKSAVELLREGICVSARNIAKKLGCSTQPIYSLFSNMKKLEEELYDYILVLHKSYIAKYSGLSGMSPYKAYGMGFIAFAKEEKQLFRSIYLSKPFSFEQLHSDVYFVEVIKSICDTYGIEKDVAERFHLSMTVFSYGLAVMQNSDSNMTDAEISELLTTEFQALSKIYLKREDY